MLIGMLKRSQPDQAELVLDRKNLLTKAATSLQSLKGQSSFS